MSLLADFHFLRQAWLLLLVPALALAVLVARARRRSGSWQTVISPALLPYLLEDGAGPRRPRSAGKGPLLPLLLTAWGLAAVAAAGPSWVRQPLPVLQKQDALVVILDLSYSLWAEDLAPSRIDRARRKLLDLLERREEGQTALVAYAGDAHVVTPLTDDAPTIANLLPALDPAMMPVPGADAPEAVEAALALLDAAAVGSGRLLLATDAIEPGELTAIAGLLEGRDVTLSVLGIGTPEGAPIPLPEGGFLKRDDGSIVIPGLPEAALEDLARRGGGRYRRIAIDDSDLAALTAEGPGPGENTETERRAEAWVDMAHWFLLPLVPLAAFAFRRGLVAALTPLALTPLALALLLPAPAARADLWSDLWLTADQQGARALAEGDAERAARTFEAPAWQGTAAYRAGDYATAIDRFSDGNDADAWYNRANALARAGRLEESIDAYERSLALAPDRQDARDNLELVKTLLDRQEQERQQSGGKDGQGQPQPGSDPGQQGEQPGQRDPGEPPGSDPGGNQRGEDTEQPGTPPSPGQPGEGRDPQGAADAEEGDPGNAAQSLEQPAPGREAGEALAQDMADDLEARQAMQQWLRRVPDDPSGLLREKFRYESRQRQRRGEERDNGKIW
ncbi:MAG: VWA domain-containing protein [Pseudohaliea sp.]